MSDRYNRVRRGPYIVMCVVGFAVFALWGIWDEWTLRHDGHLAQAVVTDQYGRGRLGEAVTFRFVPEGGQEVTVEQAIQPYERARFGVGSTVTVRYLPTDPEGARLADRFETRLIVILLPLLMSIIGGIQYLWTTRRRV